MMSKHAYLGAGAEDVLQVISKGHLSNGYA